MSCGVGHRCSADPALLWLWRRLVATALIGPLAWEPPYAVGAALEKDKRTKQKRKRKRIKMSSTALKLAKLRASFYSVPSISTDAQVPYTIIWCSMIALCIHECGTHTVSAAW